MDMYSPATLGIREVAALRFEKGWARPPVRDQEEAKLKIY